MIHFYCYSKLGCFFACKWLASDVGYLSGSQLFTANARTGDWAFILTNLKSTLISYFNVGPVELSAKWNEKVWFTSARWPGCHYCAASCFDFSCADNRLLVKMSIIGQSQFIIWTSSYLSSCCCTCASSDENCRDCCCIAQLHGRVCSFFNYPGQIFMKKKYSLKSKLKDALPRSVVASVFRFFMLEISLSIFILYPIYFNQFLTTLSPYILMQVSRYTFIGDYAFSDYEGRI